MDGFPQFCLRLAKSCMQFQCEFWTGITYRVLIFECQSLVYSDYKHKKEAKEFFLCVVLFICFLSHWRLLLLEFSKVHFITLTCFALQLLCYKNISLCVGSFKCCQFFVLDVHGFFNRS